MTVRGHKLTVGNLIASDAPAGHGAVHILRSAEGGGRGSENFLQCTSGGVGGVSPFTT